ncbi:23S rRNA (guanosine(2251)-2'-O)-methyltransferase [Luteimicrobium xylanilyticum]|uniref:23S rRNA (Guanosine(2251)-2'-O)-methyltransferase n=1 Tax=Luteimicrobium xylanilyticum TaxID=1133546 RepID=A0A5P9Q9K0_9MICO|nr:RNA methyltransferase [Luteimicrobium xylanilyticum]QFU98121.1 23S rRNA (guanosine(2251)-2'-O)-methyltransferase [Luteimicrobium xylanilyticum]
MPEPVLPGPAVPDVVTVTDSHDPRLTDYTDLTDVALRRVREPAEGLYMAESSTVIRRALAAGHRPRSFLMADKWLESMADVIAEAREHDPAVPVFVADEPLLEQITGFHLHRGALAAMHRPELPDVADLLRGARGGAGAQRVVVLEDVVDHTNIGAAMRACAAMGVDAVLLTPRSADPLYRRAVRVSMGTVFQVPWTRIHDWPHAATGAERVGGIDLLHELGFEVAALALEDDSVSLDDVATDPPERLALVFGTEGDGLKPKTIATCDLTVKIPMAGGVDSLNVASAVAVATWAVRVPEA